MNADKIAAAAERYDRKINRPLNLRSLLCCESLEILLSTDALKQIGHTYGTQMVSLPEQSFSYEAKIVGHIQTLTHYGLNIGHHFGTIKNKTTAPDLSFLTICQSVATT